MRGDQPARKRGGSSCIATRSPTLYRRFDDSPDEQPLEVLKWRDIYDNLEAATDRCEDVANILEGVVLEYS